MSRGARKVAIVVAALLLAALVWRGWPAPAGPAVAPNDLAQSTPGETAPDGVVPEAAGTQTPRADAPASALPAETLPLAQRMAELQRWSEAGHPEASCRLAIERMRCRMLRARPPQAGPSPYEQQLEREGQLEAANAEAEAGLLRLEQAAACRDANPGDEVGALALLAPAAAAGHAPSQVMYFAIGNQFRFQRGIFQHPGFDAWRRDAPRYLQAAFDAGLPEASRGLVTAYGGDTDFASGLVPDDPAQAYLHLRLRHLLDGEEWNAMYDRRPGLDDARRRQLQAEAERLHRERFGGRRYLPRGLDASAPYRLPALSASDFCGPPIPL